MSHFLQAEDDPGDEDSARCQRSDSEIHANAQQQAPSLPRQGRIAAACDIDGNLEAATLDAVARASCAELLPMQVKLETTMQRINAAIEARQRELPTLHSLAGTKLFSAMSFRQLESLDL